MMKSAKQELGINVGDDIDKEQSIKLTRLRFRCYYQILRKVGVDRFDRLIEELIASTAKTSEALGERQFKYLSKFHDPRDVLEQREFLRNLNEVVLEETDEAIGIGDTRLTEMMFVLSFVGNIINQVYLGFFEPLSDLLILANHAAGLDADWATVLIAVALEEALVKKKLRELGYEPQKKEPFHRLVEKLIELMQREKIRPDMDVFLTDGFRNIRHEVIHDPVKWKPKEKEVIEIIRHTIDLTKSLWPDLFKTDEEDRG